MPGLQEQFASFAHKKAKGKWVWLKIEQEGLRKLWSMFPLTRVPVWYRFFEPQPKGLRLEPHKGV